MKAGRGDGAVLNLSEPLAAQPAQKIPFIQFIFHLMLNSAKTIWNK